ncbi:MAG: sugar O-acetyltransferase [Oscillibacter sp.]|nr:sugar O-acetyltransferase [Oscillibacter sp.]
MDFYDRLHSGEIYAPLDNEILTEQTQYLELLYDYNQTRPSEGERRTCLLREMLAEVGENCYIEPPFHANWGGHHVHFGKWVYANFGLTCVDDTHIYVGDYVLFGPNVVLATANHPFLPELRKKGLQYNLPIHIGEGCWIGAGAVVVPGVTIGDYAVIGAGSVVTKDIPSNVLAAGNPCRVLRELDERDREYYHRDRRIDWDALLSLSK